MPILAPIAMRWPRRQRRSPRHLLARRLEMQAAREEPVLAGSAAQDLQVLARAHHSA